MEEEASIYAALVLGVRDYVRKNGFGGAVLGLSGGVDSALTLAIAVDALGADAVEGVLMPSRYTSEMSNLDALEEARSLGVKTRTISIEPAFRSFLSMLEPPFEGRAGGCHRGESPGALPRHHPDGDQQQDRAHPAHDRQQKRDGRGVRDPLRRHGGGGLRRSRTCPSCWSIGWRVIAIAARP